MSWVDTYKQKLISAQEAASLVKSGDRVYYGGNAAIPREIVTALAGRAEELEDVQLNHVLLLGEDPWREKAIRTDAARAAAWVTDSASPDTGFLYFATLANFQVGGKAWKGWVPAMKEQVIESQVMDPLPLAGSWTPRATDGKGLGRVGVTALMVMMNEVYYRYGRVFGLKR